MTGLRNFHSVVNEQKLFEDVLSLIGTNVKLQIKETAQPMIGTIVNSMFDSLLLEIDGDRKVIRFSDIIYLDKCKI